VASAEEVPGHKRKCTLMSTTVPNLPGHQEVKFAGRKRTAQNMEAKSPLGTLLKPNLDAIDVE